MLDWRCDHLARNLIQSRFLAGWAAEMCCNMKVVSQQMSFHFYLLSDWRVDKQHLEVLQRLGLGVWVRGGDQVGKWWSLRKTSFLVSKETSGSLWKGKECQFPGCLGTRVCGYKEFRDGQLRSTFLAPVLRFKKILVRLYYPAALLFVLAQELMYYTVFWLL